MVKDIINIEMHVLLLGKNHSAVIFCFLAMSSLVGTYCVVCCVLTSGGCDNFVSVLRKSSHRKSRGDVGEMIMDK